MIKIKVYYNKSTFVIKIFYHITFWVKVIFFKEILYLVFFLEFLMFQQLNCT